MLRLTIHDLMPGMRLVKDVYGEEGRVLLAAGTQLGERQIEALATHGVQLLHVASPRTTDDRGQLVPAAVRQHLTTEMRRAMAEVGKGPSAEQTGLSGWKTGLPVADLRQTVDSVVSEVVDHPDAMITLEEIRSADEYTLVHSVNVCILTTLLGHRLALRPADLVDLSMAALLHDIGKTVIPPAILKKPGKLDPAEVAVMNRHTSIGWAMLRNQDGLPESASLVALQHHEWWSGGGYPIGLAGEQIHRFARICSVADCYDALTADRVYKKGMRPDEALAIMSGTMREHFEPTALAALTACVTP